MGMPSFFGFDEPGRDREHEARLVAAGAAGARHDAEAGVSTEEMVEISVRVLTDRHYKHGYSQELGAIASERGVNGWQLHLLVCAACDRKYGRAPAVDQRRVETLPAPAAETEHGDGCMCVDCEAYEPTAQERADFDAEEYARCAREAASW